ncbi:hypothetical protein [Streptomyces sp. NBC_01334]|uniref:hypothetical protein n=1 Tax=Streptomyces sp. NBC_01334 TaxID=2903827 RepID=UPI002E11F390|nr:hypothetical protein OG736_45430 [Streptomyces sp. NBC_01334]
MWWSDETNQELVLTVQRLLTEYRRHLESIEPPAQPLVWGVGSAPDAFGGWTPSPAAMHGKWSHPPAMAHDKASEKSGSPSPGRYEHWVHPLVVANHDEVRSDGLDPLPGRYSLPSLRDAWRDTRLLHLLESWGVPDDTLIDLAGRPVPACQVNPTDEVSGRRPVSSATVGVTCRAGGSPAFITAGHLVAATGERVDVCATGPGGPKWVTGTVVDWQDPLGAGATGGYDYAVVVLDDPNDTVASVTHTGLTPTPRPPYVTTEVAVFGGPSGRRDGTVNGALNQLGDAQRQWLNVWQFGQSGLLQRGDSGSLAMVTDGPHQGSVLGHFVGGAGTTPRRFDHQYIQDLRSCLANGKLQIQVTLWGEA